MRPDGRIERWDELQAAMRHNFPLVSYRDRQQRTAGISSVSRFWMLLDLALREHQTWFRVADNNNRILLFPFAWYLERGMIIRNITNNSSYVVESVLDVKYTPQFGSPTNVRAVLIGGGITPKTTDRLVFPEDKYLVFRPCKARAWADTVNFKYATVPNEEYKSWTNTITYYLVRREPGSVGDKPFGSPKERKPRYRSFERDLSFDPTVQVSMHGQLFDNIAQFDCWAKEASEADSLADYFEQFLALWTGVIEYNGIERIWYWSRGEDAVETSWRNDIAVRSLQYFFRTEDVDVQMDYLRRGISVVVSTSDTLATSATGISSITGDIFIEIIGR